jgi:shikimate kinase
MIVTLIGYRGSGKSSVVEAKAKATIREIFDRHGEAEFRRLERETIVELLGEDKLVIAAGGGAILNADTRTDMRAAGPVVWLQAPVDVLAGRIGGDPTTSARRPDLVAGGGRAEIERLLALREPLYREAATLIVDTENRAIDDVVAEIAGSLDPLVRGGGAA